MSVHLHAPMSVRTRPRLSFEAHEPRMASMPAAVDLQAFAARRPFAISPEHAATIRRVVATISSFVSSPAYQQHVWAWASDIAQHTPRNSGVLFGFDFHLTARGPVLIEVNTNAGGALLACAGFHASPFLRSALRSQGDALEQSRDAIVDSLLEDWEDAGHHRSALRTVAIVDENPMAQFLSPEFELYAQALEARGIRALVADVEDLTLTDGALRVGGHRVDLVYNRLTDFYLSSPQAGALRTAYLSGDVVCSPHPACYAAFADKRNLVTLSDESLLKRIGATQAQLDLFRDVIPRAQIVTVENSAALWANRRRLFFKPMNGFGSKAVYRGDKLTRKTWEQIQTQAYIAQEFVPPSTVACDVDGVSTTMKADLRCFAFKGVSQLMIARLYSGQTTNLRTHGGGFAPVIEVNPDVATLKSGPLGVHYQTGRDGFCTSVANFGSSPISH